MELTTLAEFRTAVRSGRVIVITDTANGVKAHRTDCPRLTEDYFIQKVVDGRRKNGSYFSEATLGDATRAHDAVPCRACCR